MSALPLLAEAAIDKITASVDDKFNAEATKAL